MLLCSRVGPAHLEGACTTCCLKAAFGCGSKQALIARLNDAQLNMLHRDLKADRSNCPVLSPKRRLLSYQETF